MIDQGFLEMLPGDPEEAFSLLELKLRSQIPPQKEFRDSDEQQSYDFERVEFQKQYVICLAAFLEEYQIDIGIDFIELMSLTEYAFINRFDQASVKIQFYGQRCAFRLNARKRAGSTAIYVLSAAAKERIRKQIDIIRNELENAEITDLKRDALSKKLSAFSKEVELDRTRIETVASLYVAAKKEGEKVSKIITSVEKIFNHVASGGKELWKALPELEVTARLSAPQAKIEDKSDFNLDDDIPF